MVSNVRSALARKFGPLPAWAWALLGGLAIFVYRTRRGGATTVSDTTGTDASSGSGSGAADPVTLQPGESVYNPATGQLVSTAPEQQPPGDPAPTPEPVTLDPGQGVYDPATGDVSTVGGSGPGKPPGHHRVHGRPDRHKPKPKPHHQPGNVKHPGHKGHSKTKPHGEGAVKDKTHTPRHKPPKPHGKPRAVPGLHPAAKPAAPARHTSTPKHPAVRQRPEASHPKPHPASHAHPKATPPKPRKHR